MRDSLNDAVPAVSAVIPTRNRPHLVCNAVRSALSQKFESLEVVVVIDGPDPATERALAKIADPRLTVIVNPTNAGQAVAKNLGVLHARGQWIALLDDDDEWLPRKLEAQMPVAARLKSEYAFVTSRFIERTSGAERVLPDRLPKDTRVFSEYLFCEHGNIHTSTLLISRDLLLKVPFVRGLQVEDTDWLLRVTADERTELGSVDEPLSIYNNHGTGERVTSGGNWEDLYTWSVCNRELFTPRAFSMFLLTYCTSRARRDHEPVRVFLRLLLTSIRLGEFNLRAIVYFAGYCLFPPEVRRRWRVRLVRLFRRRARATQVPPMATGFVGEPLDLDPKPVER